MQLSIFSEMFENYKIKKPIRLIELYAGYGSQALALKYLGANFEHYKICEWATKSIQAYNDIHIKDYTDYSKDFTRDEIINKLFDYGISLNYNEPMTLEQIKRKDEQWQRTTYNNIIATHNLVNVAKVKGSDLKIVDTNKYDYIMTYSFPCQDLSLAGKGKGMKKDSGTRSGMLWEVERILDELEEKPQILLMENVPQVIGTNSIKDFQDWELKLESLGYSNYVEVLNAKDFGIPQNRERCFMISILGEYNYTFPQKEKLKLRLKDMLEEQVDEKYYLNQNGLKYVLNRTPIGEKQTRANNIIGNDAQRNVGTITTSTTYRGEDNYICESMTQKEVDEKIYLKNKLCENLIKSVIVKIGNYSPSGHNAASIVDSNGISPTVMENHGTITAIVDVPLDNLRIRKLTPKECFRLMGVKDEDYENVAKNQSNASLYHLAGDSIVVNVLMAIFKNIL